MSILLPPGPYQIAHSNLGLLKKATLRSGYIQNKERYHCPWSPNPYLVIIKKPKRHHQPQVPSWGQGKVHSVETERTELAFGAGSKAWPRRAEGQVEHILKSLRGNVKGEESPGFLLRLPKGNVLCSARGRARELGQVV